MKYLLSLLLLAASSFCSAQDSLVFYSDLTFNSEIEKNVFDQFINHNSDDLFGLFMCLNSSVNEETLESARSIFNSKFEELNNEKLNAKSPNKRVKTIYQEVHKDFFEQYRMQNHFNEIFETGRYNCVSATALYGIYLDKLNIPYTIKEKPTHVYLIAYPESDRILVESTDPTGGFVKYNTAYKQDFVNRMVQAKLISQADAKSKSLDQLFDEYYFYDTDITITELAGIQYMNDALYKIEQKDFEGAYHQMEKARMLYKSDKSTMLLLALNIELIDNQKYTEIENIDLLIKLSRFKNYGIDNDIVLGEFSRVINTQLIDLGREDELEKYYNRLIQGITDDELKNEISFIYYYEQGRALFNQGKYTECLKYFEQAYQLKPTNLDVNNVFVSALARTLQFSSNKEVLGNLEKYKDKYPSLLDNNIFKSILANSYLIEFGSSFDLGKESEGKKYKQLFEKYYDPELTIDHGNLGRSYSIAAVYYFRKGYNSKAKAILNEGLNMSPHNHELLVRKSMIR